ncbi:MAG: glycosyltransferase [archaeon]
MNSKILVGCPTSNHKKYCVKEYLEGIKNLTYKNFDVVVVDNSEDDGYYKELKKLGVNVIKDKYFENARDRIVHSRNILRKKVLDEGYDYLLSLEQDIVPPKDVIERLLEHKKDIISGLYFYLGDDKKTLLPVVWVHYEGKYARRLYLNEVTGNRIIEAITCGLGCVLIHRKVLEEIEFRYVKEKPSWDDLWFSEDARTKGFKVYVDTSIKCKHYNKGMDWNNIKK